MPFFDACKEKILSEEYRDFIVANTSGQRFAGVPREKKCQLETDFFYRITYVDRSEADPIGLENYAYNEIPKCYTLLGTESLQQAGILQAQNYPGLELLGEGIMIGFVDTGIDYTNAIFKNLDGSTRIVGIWDQTIQEGMPPDGFFYGSEYSREMIDEGKVPSTDTEGHGTFVASVCAGGADENTGFLGAAPEAFIGVVKLKEAKQYLREYYFIQEDAKCYQETDVMLGIKYLHRLAEKLNLPLVLCVALGTNQGSHDGTAPLDGLLELYANLPNRAVVIGGGNEAGERHHFQGESDSENGVTEVEIRVGDNVEGFCMELWTDLPNIMGVSILSPTGERIPQVPIRRNVTETYQFLLEGTTIYLDYVLLAGNSSSELIFVRVEKPAAGIWRFDVAPVLFSDGVFHMWLPVKEFLGGEVYFLEANPDNTLTEPSNIISGITVAAYNGNDNSIAISSGRGYTREGRIKPDLAAPGVYVTGVAPGSRQVTRSGSSAATSIAAGAAALMMELILYRAKQQSIDAIQIRNLLILGTRKRPGEAYPNREWGYGELDLFRTFEVIRSI